MIWVVTISVAVVGFFSVKVRRQRKDEAAMGMERLMRLSRAR